MTAERVFELVRHLTERDREIALTLYDQQVLTTDQLALLFFSSKRRAQDRLLFLYQARVLDRFFPPSRFGTGKPQAHWLLDEAGALLVAAMRRVERKNLGWQRREDWSSHPQLTHRLESNRLVTELIAATLPDPSIGVTAWLSSRDAAERLGVKSLRPDGCFILDSAAGAAECYLEWDRGTETGSTLADKLEHYRLAEGAMHYSDQRGMRNVLFVVPGPGRIATLCRAYEAFAPAREWNRQSVYRVSLDGDWPLLAATVSDLDRHGLLAPVWQSITDPDEPPRALTQLPVRTDWGATDLGLALGRRWRHDRPDFWERLSPLGRAAAEEPREVGEVAKAATDPAQPSGADAAQAASPIPETDPAEGRHPAPDEGFLARRRAELEEELHSDIAAARSRRGNTAGPDLRPSEIAGFMDDPEPDEEGS